MKYASTPRERRHTLYFLDEIRRFSPVFLDTEVLMQAIQEHRQATRADGSHFSVATYVLHAAARVLKEHPEANAAMRGHIWPRVAYYPFVNGKVTLDKRLRGQRVVLSTVLENLERTSLPEIQRQLDHFREGDADTMPEFAAIRVLDRLPWPWGPLAVRMKARPLGTRPSVWGTFAVTSLGHRPVDGFHSVGGTTVTIGIGRVTDRPVALAGKVTVAPTMRLNLAFDHRVIDGAEAADVLADIKDRLEQCPGDGPRHPTAQRSSRARDLTAASDE
jgi:pyruvate/2-oxoglutarate dehydrogenase complex dihydrolipoamide acyltransferase (E2) component